MKYKLPPEFFAAVALLLYGLLILVLAMWQPPAWAQVQSSPPPMQAASTPTGPVGCTPNTWATPQGNGSPLWEVKTDKARGYFGWCRQPAPVDGDQSKWYWQIIMHQWCITKPPSITDIVTGGPACIDPPKTWDYGAALRRVVAASSPDAAIAQIRTEFAAARVGTTDPQQLYERERLLWEGCKALKTAPYPVMPIGLLAFDPPGPSPAECGNAPTPPAVTPPPMPVYVVTAVIGSTTRDYYAVVSGVRTTKSAGTIATGTTCDCSRDTGLEMIEFNVIRYCKIPAAVLAVTNCSVKK